MPSLVRLFLLGLAVCSTLSASVVFAKRSAPAPVPNLADGAVEYRAPHAQLGCVECWDPTRNEMLWRRQIYVVRYNAELERDVQDIFIKTLRLRDGALIVQNERDSEYRLDLDTLEVRPLRGPLVESVKR